MLLAVSLASTTLSPAQAQLLAQALTQPLAPPVWPVGQAELRLNAETSGALFDARQPGDRGVRASGVFLLMPELRRDDARPV